MNERIRAAIREAKLKQWQVAEACGIAEFTFCRWLRHELTDEQREKVMQAIERLKGGQSE